LTTIAESKDWKRPFFTFWVGQVISLLGSSLVQFAVVWWMTVQTGSGLVLGTASALNYVPQIFLGPFVGALVDRWNRRLVMILSDLAVALSTLVMVLLFWSGQIQIWHIYVIILIRSLGAAFQWPAMMATTSLMVPEGQLTRIGGLNQAMQGGIQIAGPPLGALLLGLLPIYGVLSVDILTAALAILPLLFIFVPQPAETPVGEVITPRVVLADVKVGFRYIISWPGLLGVIILAIFLNALMNPSFVMIPLLVREHFNGGAWHLGAIESAGGIGMIMGGLLLTVWGGFRKRVVTALVGTIIMSLAILSVGLIPPTMFSLVIVAFLIDGVANTAQNASFFAIMQARVAAHMQGRVFTLMQSLIVAVAPISTILAGSLVEKWGAARFFLIAGGAGVLGGVAAFFVPTIMSIEKNGHALSTEEEIQTRQPMTSLSEE
jgi:DHA3 family macrolide efflux protein-like MFS transporter